MQKSKNIVKIDKDIIRHELKHKEFNNSSLNVSAGNIVKMPTYEEQKKSNENEVKNIMNKGAKMKIIKQVAVASLAAMAGLSLFACSKPEEKIILEFDKELNTNETKNTEKEVKTQTNGNNVTTEGSNKTDSNNSVNKGKNGENIENDTNNSNKTEETKVGTINVGSIDLNTAETYDNTAEIEAQSKAMLNKGLPTNSYGYTKEDIKNMTIPDYILASGDKESSIRLSLEKRDYLWEYMKDPANFKVDYSLSDKEFIKKYGTTKTSTNGYKSHITGLQYTFGADGFPIEHPRGRNTEITNPYNGKTYRFVSNEDTWEDKDNPIPRRKATEEELNEIAAAYSASFK